ncbi:MAG: hypothetical protein V4555_19995 [Acidobacteriota bacterium]
MKTLPKILSLILFTTTLHAQSQLASSSSDPLPDAPLSEPPAPAPAPHPTHRHVETSISLGGFGDLTSSRIINNNSAPLTTLSTSPAAGVLGTVRQSFTPWLGYSLNLGYARTTSTYTLGNAQPGTPFNFSIHSNVYEASLAWLGQKQLSPRLTGFVTAGAGFLAYLPAQPGYFVDYRPEAVGSIGVNYHLTPALALRAEYRGQFYKFADFGFEPARRMTLSSQPTLSLVYTFHAKSK